MKALAAALGPDCEVVLHDLRHPQTSIVMVENGHVTGRKVGDGIRDLIVSVLRSEQFGRDALINYATHLKDGRTIRSTTILIRDSEENVIGALCLNFNLTRLQTARKLLDDLSTTFELSEPTDQEVEVPRKDVVAVLQSLIANAVQEVGMPPESMQRDDRVRLIGFLDGKGVFLVKGSVELVAGALGISRFTVYNYLEEARSPKLGGRT